MASDSFFISPTDELLTNRLVTNKDSADTFVYLYNHKGEITGNDLGAAILGFALEDVDLGVGHGDDSIPIFPFTNTLISNIIPSKEDRLIQETMSELWVNFATTG